MAEKKSFEEILDAPFRWPQLGDKAFAKSGRYSDDASLTADEFIVVR